MDINNKSKIKIIFFVPHLKISGGVSIMVNYANQLAILGYDVKVVVINKVFVRRYLANIFGYKPNWLKNTKFKILRISNVDDIKKSKINPDILIVSASSQAKLVEGFAKKIVYFVQHDERLYHNNEKDVTYTYKLPYMFLTVSSWLKVMLETEFKQKSHLLLNTIDRKIFYPRKIDKKDGEIRIIILHHDYEWKGTKEGVKIVEDLKKKYHNIKLIMFGARKDNIENPCDEYYYKPTGDDLAMMYSGCDIYLCPSWDEGFGLTNLESMACGCAVVTYDNGGSRDYAFDNQTALVAERKNVDDLKHKLEMLISDSDLRKKIRKGGINFSKELPTLEDQSKKLGKFL